jgi:hypothetical protein
MRLWRTFVDNGHESGWWFWAAVASLPVAWLVVVAGRSVLGQAPLDPDARRFLAVFLPATAASTIGAQILLSGAVVPGPRYNLPILFLPLLLLASLVPPRWPSPVHRGVLAVPVAIALVWSASALDEIDPTGPDHIACVRRQLELSGSVTGVASYWDARDLVVYLDDPDVTVGTYDLFGRPEQINVSADSYRDRYDFVLRSERVPLWELDLGMIEAINGEPDTAIECGIYTLWDYGPSGMTMDPFPQPGSSVVFDGCDLDTEVGALDAGSCTLSSTGEAGYLDFGPYVAVPPGTYRVEIAYQAAGDEPLGTWDVATFHQHGETPTVVEEGELAGTGGGVGHVELEWTAANDPTGELTVAEIRTRVDAGASGQLLSIELTRIS